MRGYRNNDRDPLWGLLVERNPNYKELAVKPGYNLNQKEFVKFEKNENIQKNKDHLNTVKNLDGLNVNGSNLLDLEYKREMSTKGRKVLHKVFVENGKTIGFDVAVTGISICSSLLSFI